ncbi:MAG: hypothetical protein OXM59_10205 [Gammaproteobacteria bacterium]|nr:hypothetical protein [Gammaproteobacteria bacterium]
MFRLIKAPAPTVVFNNPLDSFHNTVAEAKEEREQLDRLLTISTPRERLLVVGIALLLCIVAAWLFFGSVVRTVALDGVLVEPGEGTGSIAAFVWIESGVAPEIEVGMPAGIELSGADGSLDGEVAKVAALPVPDRVAALAPVFPHRIDIGLEEDVLFPAGLECRIVIELGRQAPVALFGMRRQ